MGKMGSAMPAIAGSFRLCLLLLAILLCGSMLRGQTAITRHPESLTVNCGESATLNVTAQGA